MAAITRAIYRTTGMEFDVDGLTPVALFCAIGLLTGVVAAMVYGLDLDLSTGL